ncbi:TetR/AcrR family transcriptional regulator [Leuconostoc suionicum]|uniref:TetR/AcrR family transcriptional regulator n=1 Tax=Leuconostoc suionicum TaxID=1511761 RepID=UPI0021A9E983|nr:TetR/AcrR family transcriptional regulator [Leuconostoc suionicum]MCT4382635.1 TetR/AcrR family transcriptional regulator [Leuconostoc suionicum]MDC2806884.1 TetR/AcrR family transcriptional regulator [Leuconostoc suionicum]MDC2817273.1 TetR/AcrR family transcriptional regulator [Leuconostoc suionicum]MDC2824396.1 TetR/AcrR family transcriptional regulator [Leuconostoc suionicum]
MSKQPSKYDLILNAFTTLLVQEGYQSTTINKIAETANVNPSTIFRKFKDKEGMLSAIIDRHLADLRTIFDDVSLTGDVETDLINMSRAFQKFQEKHQAVVVVGVQESFRKPNVSHAVEEIEISFKQTLLQYFAEMKKQHQIKETIDIEATTMNIIWLNFGYFMTVIRFNNPELITDPEDFYEKQIRFFAKSLRP